MSKVYLGASLAFPTLQAILGLPMWLGVIPPNRLYGYRTEQSLASADAWYELNQSAGFAMLATALALFVVVGFVWRFSNLDPKMKLAACGISAAVSMVAATAFVPSS